MLPLTDLSCKYLTPIKYGETVLVKTYLQKATKVRLIMGYKVYAEERNVLCGEGTTGHAWTDSHLKPVNIAKYKPDLYQMLLLCIIMRRERIVFYENDFEEYPIY